jgi:hypothetical protein
MLCALRANIDSSLVTELVGPAKPFRGQILVLPALARAAVLIASML